MATLLYQGHASVRIVANDGRVIYIDPYKGQGYDLPADIILVTHDHRDHNQIDRCAQKPDSQIITSKEALDGNRYNSINAKGFIIHAAEANNEKHDPKQCVGYIFTVDNVKLYVAGDTSKTKQMERFSELEIDYAFLPGDGLHNMDPGEAAECARLIKAKHNILYHLKPGDLHQEIREKWDAPDKLILEEGEEIELH